MIHLSGKGCQNKIYIKLPEKFRRRIFIDKKLESINNILSKTDIESLTEKVQNYSYSDIAEVIKYTVLYAINLDTFCLEYMHFEHIFEFYQSEITQDYIDDLDKFYADFW